jgi:hypothetical protein
VNQDPLQMMQMALAFWMSRSLYAAAELGVADHLKDGPRSAEELATAIPGHAPSLRRLLRFLCSVGALVEDPSRRFALTPLGATLRSDVPGSMRALVRTLGLPISWQGWGEIVHSLQTGQPGVDKIAGEPLFDYLAKHPVEAGLFNDFVAGLYGAEAPLVAAAYDFSAMQKVVDVGGGTGTLLATILERSPGLSGVLFDLPHVTGPAREHLGALGLGDRCDVIGGSFFEAVPPGGDAYLLSHIIHDWDEERCLAVLERCREVMSPSAKLLLVETVLSSGNEPDPGKLIDMAMMVITGGQERTQEEYAALLSKAGFTLTQVIPTGSPSSIVEAVPR